MTEINIESFLKDYYNIRNIKQLADQYNVSYYMARKTIHNNGYIDRRKYTCNDYLFSSLNEESLYLAGFLGADGSINDKKNRISITLSIKDKIHLLKIKNLLEATNPLKKEINKLSKRNSNWKDSELVSLLITSKQISNDLKKFNIKPRKTFTYRFPEFLICNSEVNHFMRGYFDGDGCVFIEKAKPGRKTGQLGFSLRGTVDFLNSYNKILCANCDIKWRPDKVKLNCNIGLLKYTGNKIATSIYDFLYKNSSIYMDRKYNIVKGFK